MSVTIKTGAMKYKNGGGEYVSFNAVASESTATQITAINAAGANQISAIQTKGAETLDTIPDDYTELQNDVNNLKSALFCNPGDFWKVDLVTDYTLHQGKINSDKTIDSTVTNRVCIKVPLEANSRYYLFFGRLEGVDKIWYTDDTSGDFTFGQACIPSIDTGANDCMCMVSFKRTNNGTLLISDEEAQAIAMYKVTVKQNIDVSGDLESGYFSFSQGRFVESSTRVNLEYTMEPGKTYMLTAPDGVNLRELTIFSDATHYWSLFTSATNSVAMVTPFEGYNKFNLILAKPNTSAEITVAECQGLVMKEVY